MSRRMALPLSSVGTSCAVQRLKMRLIYRDGIPPQRAVERAGALPRGQPLDQRGSLVKRDIDRVGIALDQMKRLRDRLKRHVAAADPLRKRPDDTVFIQRISL